MTSDDESTFLRALFDRYDIRGVHVHHCTWLYQRLPWIRAQFPGTQLVDSLARPGVAHRWLRGHRPAAVQRHRRAPRDQPPAPDYLVDQQNLSRSKVALATLADLTVPAAEEPPAGGDVEGPLTVAFVGRFTQQKRPYLFLRLARTLHRRLGDRVRFVMHGDGELGEEIRRDHARLGLQSVVEMRTPATPVSRTLAEADVLVICSDKRGRDADLLRGRRPRRARRERRRRLPGLGRRRGPARPAAPRSPAGPDGRPGRRAGPRTVPGCPPCGRPARQGGGLRRAPRARDWTRDLYERWNS